MIPEGWHYVPHGSTEPVQVIAPLIGGYDDGNAVEIGAAEELPDHLEPGHRQQVGQFLGGQRRVAEFA